MIEAQIAKLAPNYQPLCRLDWAGQEAMVDVVCEMQVVDVSSARWKEPASAVVTAPIRGDTSRGNRSTSVSSKTPMRRSTARSSPSCPATDGGSALACARTTHSYLSTVRAASRPPAPKSGKPPLPRTRARIAALGRLWSGWSSGRRSACAWKRSASPVGPPSRREFGVPDDIGSSTSKRIDCWVTVRGKPHECGL